MSRERLVPLTSELPASEGFPLQTCNWDDDRDVPAVVALEHDGGVHHFYGVCCNHAEVMNRSYEWTENSQQVPLFPGHR